MVSVIGCWWIVVVVVVVGRIDGRREVFVSYDMDGSDGYDETDCGDGCADEEERF